VFPDSSLQKHVLDSEKMQEIKKFHGVNVVKREDFIGYGNDKHGEGPVCHIT
jgi:hypothetical protein